LLDLDGGRLLVDTPPELRLQLLASGVRSVQAVWFTHVHADHVHGIDDLRAFTVRGGDLPAYVGHEYREPIARHFQYIFDDNVVPLAGTSKPRVRLHDLRAGERQSILGEDFLPIEVPHGLVRVYGFRVRGLGYITDGKSLPPAALSALQGVDVLVINALWFGKPHPSHFNVEEATAAARAVGAGRTYLTHLTHRVTHRELMERLPPGVEPAYDGLTIDV
jgi:phosphoribosyl 1,2-cyclic phosphate phosphodiesterase